MRPLFGPPHQPSSMHDRGALYRMCRQVFAPLYTASFARQRGVQAPPTTGGISLLIRRVRPCSPDKHLPHQPVIARKTRRIIVWTVRSRTLAIMWANGRSLRAQDQYCGLRCNECGPETSERINDCGPGRVLYCEPGVQLVRAATPTPYKPRQNRYWWRIHFRGGQHINKPGFQAPAEYELC
jgi:hypothetical protein